MRNNIGVETVGCRTVEKVTRRTTHSILTFEILMKGIWHMRDNMKMVWEKLKKKCAQHADFHPLFFALVICSFVLTIGMSLAYMFSKQETVTNTFVAGEVSCTVEEEWDQATNTKSSITVTNTGNVPAYIRVRLVSYWKDASGNIVGKESELPANLDSCINTSAWIKGNDESTAGSAVYYYGTTSGTDTMLTAVNPPEGTYGSTGGNTTESLLSSNLVLGTTTDSLYTDENGKPITLYQVLDVFAEAIQSEPDDAVKEAWPSAPNTTDSQ